VTTAASGIADVGTAVSVAFAPDGRLLAGLDDGRAVLLPLPRSAAEERVLARAARIEALRTLLDSLARGAASRGYRDSPPHARLEGARVSIALPEGAGHTVVRATVLDDSTIELQVGLVEEPSRAGEGGDPGGPPEAVETFAGRLARWIRVRLGKAPSSDHRPAEPWIDALPDASAIRAARVDRGRGEVTFTLAEVPSTDALFAWIRAWREQGA
jgi:hypothetical protein